MNEDIVADVPGETIPQSFWLVHDLAAPKVSLGVRGGNWLKTAWLGEVE